MGTFLCAAEEAVDEDSWSNVVGDMGHAEYLVGNADQPLELDVLRL